MSLLRGIMKRCSSIIVLGIGIGVEFGKKGLKNLHLAILQGKMNGVTAIFVLGVDVCIGSCRQRSYDINAFVFHSQEKWCPAVISRHISVGFKLVDKTLQHAIVFVNHGPYQWRLSVLILVVNIVGKLSPK